MFYKKPVKKNNPVILIVSIVVLFILMIASVIAITMLNKSKNWNTNGKQVNYTIDQEIITQWDISTSDNLSLYTNILTSDDEKFGLKSKTIDLSQWQGYVYVKWTISDIKNNIPIIEVSEINYYGFDEQSTDELSWDEENEISDQSMFDFPEYWFYLDFSNTTEYTAQNQDGKILIQKINNIESNEQNSWDIQTWNNLQTIFTILPYKCVPGDSLKDCQTLLDNSKKFGYSEFKTSEWVVFYNISETENRNFFNWLKWGYRVESTENIKFEKIAKFIHIYDDEYIKSKLSSTIKTTCKDYKNQLENPTNYKIYMQDEKLIAEITWTDSKTNTISCILEVKLGSTIVAKLLNLENLGINTEEETDATTWVVQTWNQQSGREWLEEVIEQVKEETTETLSWTTAQIDEPANMLKFQSNQWYLIYLPKYTSFERQTVDSTQNLWISGIKCTSKVNVINAKQKENLSTNPSAEIYICSSDLDDSEIQNTVSSQDMVYKKWPNSNIKYIVKYNDTEWAKIANEIVVN